MSQNCPYCGGNVKLIKELGLLDLTESFRRKCTNCGRFIDNINESNCKVGDTVCKVGDTVYQTDGVTIYKSTIKKIIYDAGEFAFDERAIGKTVFTTQESAEVRLKELQEGKK